MSTNTDPFGYAMDLLTAPLHPYKLMSHLSRVREATQNGGCKSGCLFDRDDGSRLPWDTAGKYGGWGGYAHHGTDPGATHVPLLFVHGNQRDACDWERHAESYLDCGVGGDSLWAISFARGTSTHDEMAKQLDAFVSHVRDETDCDRVAVVSHSLGVTGVRYWLQKFDRYEWVRTFVGLAGANHGMDAATVCCQTGMTDGPFRVSQFLRADHRLGSDHPLTRLNVNETPGDIEYYTIRGMHDDLFWMNRDSPKLAGAEENVVLPTDHDGVRESTEAVSLVFDWAVEPLPQAL